MMVRLDMRAATLEDADFLFGLANDPYVRQNSVAVEPISVDVHTQWMRNMLRRIESGHAVMYVAWCDCVDGSTARCGVFRVDNAGSVSVAIHEAYRGKGLAAEILQRGTRNCYQEIGRKEYIAWIKPDNIPSQKAFAKAGFERRGEQSFPGKRVNGPVCQMWVCRVFE